LYNYLRTGKLEATPGGPSITEGIGQGRVTQNLKDAPIDESMFVSDQQSVNMVMTNVFSRRLFNPEDVRSGLPASSGRRFLRWCFIGFERCCCCSTK
jgi:cysteine synthase